MADEIEVAELSIKKSDGDWEIYSNRIYNVQQLDYGVQDDSDPLNSATQMVRIDNTGATAIRVAVRDPGSFTINASNSIYLGVGAVIDIQVEENQGQIVSTINA